MAQRKLISFDWAMKKFLRSKANFEILEGFLSELLMEDVTILEILESESNQEDVRDKFNRVDLKVKNEKKEILIIEVQYEREFDYLQRILFGTSKVITEHLQKKEPYSKVARVISINILYFDLGHGDDYVYHGTTSFRGLHEQDLLQLSEEQQNLYGRDKLHEIFPEYYLVKVNNFNDIAKDTLDEWIYFLKNEEIKGDFKAKGLEKAKQELDILKLSDEERQAYERYQDDLHYQASMVESSYTIGVKKGEDKKALQIAMNLIKKGVLDAQEIAEITELPVEEINKMIPSKEP
ncbi:MAG: Rpn family recombination-promoting nuclease/putative transposase [Candidatus Electrothrix sp. AW1]|nr:Rpn family recombination-promoting nuclease/putative transposase [Candidatus Electrothrix sp. AX1]MCI5181039.1 Rpn family recombination-promoting nuclease/putative transposase [Candidatus Electrothrix gigas]